MRLQYLKWPDFPHWRVEITPLGEDAHGRWFMIPRGRAAQKGLESPIEMPATCAVLVPKREWWIATFYAQPSKIAVYVDITTHARQATDTITLVDLDLDVIREWDGSAAIVDEDEFAENQLDLQYPPAVIESARTAADAILEQLEQGSEPFGEIGPAWVERALKQLAG